MKWIAVTILIFVSSCASGPELAKYPVAEIDRPYTLPQGVAFLTSFHIRNQAIWDL